MSSSMNTETKVGALVLAAAVGFGWMATKSGSFGVNSVSDDFRTFESNFDNADGLTIGSPIKMAGVRVGEITDIYLSSNGYATVSMHVKEGVPLPANIRTQIASSGLIGEKFIALTTDFTPEGHLEDDVINIPSIGSASVDDIATNFAQISEDLKQVSTALRTSLGGKENADKLTRIVNNIDGIGTRLNYILSDEIAEGQVKKIIDGIASFSEKLETESGDMIGDLRMSASSLRRILGDNEDSASKMIRNLAVASDNLAVITDKIAEGEGFLGQMMMEDNSALDDFAAAMRNIQEVAQKINNGEGTIGRLINDPATADKIDEALDSFAELSGRMNAFTTEVDFHGYQLAAEDVTKGRFNITLRPRPTRYYTFGITGDGFATESEDPRTETSLFGQDFGDELKFTAQFGHVFQNAIGNQDIGFRIGIKDSSFGLGTDMAFADGKFEFSTDFYDFGGDNSGDGEQVPHLDFTARYNLVDRMLYAIGGYDNALDAKYGSPFIGLGFRFIDDDLKFLASQAL